MQRETGMEALRALEILGAEVGVVHLRQVVQKIWVDVALSRKQRCEQLLFFGAVRLREDVAQKVMLRSQLVTNIQRIPL